MDSLSLAIVAIKTLIIYLGVIQVVPVMIWVERRGAGLIQDRPGPNRVGPFGLFQPVADVIKFLWKEDPVPLEVNRFLYNLAPFLALVPASLTLAVLPIADHFELFGRQIPVHVVDLDVGLLFLLAIGSLGIYGILFGGWSSNNKFSLFGAVRASAQILSYEIPLGLAAVAAVMFYGTLSLRDMAFAQEGLLFGLLPNWGVFYQPLGFFVFFVAAFAETNRLPFDLPETETELVGGYHTEYGSMKFATYFMAEYMNMATMSGVMTALYFGAWHLPYVSDASLLAFLGDSRNLLTLVQVLVFVTKIALFMLLFVWVRWTLPRFRFDQLMNLSWRGLIPLGLVNLIVSTIAIYFLGRV